MVMQSLRNGASGGFIKYILFGLLVLAVAGLVLMDVNGVFRNGVGSSNVARIEGKTISIQTFDKIARATLSRIGMTPQQAYTLGYIDEILAQEIRANFILLEAEKLGIQIDKSHIAKKIAETIAPMAQDGQSIQDTFEQILLSQGLTEEEFVNGINREMIGDIMLKTIHQGFAGSSDILARNLFSFQNQTRDVELLSFMDADITDIPAATEEQKQRLYNAFKETRFAVPEYRTLKIAVINDSKIKEEIDISDNELRRAYEENIEQFEIPEQHVIEQAMFKNEENADAVFDLVKNKNTPLAEAVKEIENETVSYIPAVPFEAKMMIEQIREPVLSAQNGDFIGPIKTALGFHIIHLVDKTPPTTKSFEESKEALETEMLFIKTGDQIYTLSTVLDDLLAGGASLEEAMEDVPLTLSEIPATSQLGQDKDGNNAFLSYGPEQEQDREILIETAFELQTGEISRVIELPSGKFAALQVTNIEEKTYEPYEAVQEEINDQYIKDQQRVENTKRVSEILEQLQSGDTDIATLAKENKKEVKAIKGIKINGPLEEPLDQNARPVIFKETPGNFASIPLENGSAIIKITGYALPDINEDTDKAIIKPLISATNEETKNEAFIMYLDALSQKYTAQTNQKLLQQVYGATEDTY